MNLYDLVEGIKHDIREYLTNERARLEEQVKAGVKISQWGNEYEILIAGHRITAEHDSSQHRWRFKIQRRESEPAPWHRDVTFFEISEKKGEAIIRFLHALQEAIKSSQDPAAGSEENLAMDRGEDFLGDSSQDPAAEDKEIIGDDGDEDGEN